MARRMKLLELTCRKCECRNPWVYFAPVTYKGEGTCICFDCAKARGWTDSEGNLAKGVAL
jgi:sulfur relay (sulfurtransferase) complex TusBCD TusD component (DsrE family)